MSAGSISSTRALLRRSRRLAVRSPLRTLWTGLLVLVAVAAGAMVMSADWGQVARSRSPERNLGAADAVYLVSDWPAEQTPALTDALTAALPDGSAVAVQQVVSGLTLTATTSTDGGEDLSGPAAYGAAYQADWSAPELTGVLHVVEGRAPRDGEAVLTADTASTLGLGVGDHVRIDFSAVPLTVVGVGTVGPPDEAGVVLSEGQLVPAEGSAAVSAIRVYVDLPAGTEPPPADDLSAALAAETDTAVRTSSIVGPVTPSMLSRASTAKPDAWMLATSDPGAPLARSAGLLVAVLVVVGVLAGAAFGLGATRRMRATGLLAANGADDGHLVTAAASEALVVALPAAVLGVVVAWAARGPWIRLRLPGWASSVDATLPWPWALAVVAAAVLASTVGAVAFSRPMRTTTTSALLDGRGPSTGAASGRGGAPRPVPWWGWALGALLLWWLASSLLGVFTPGGMLGGLVVLPVVGLWVGLALLAVRVARAVLGRDPLGRLVARDLRRRRISSTAAVMVVATWVFIAVAGTATDWGRTVTVTDGMPSVTTDYFVDPTAVSTTGWSGVPSPSPTTIPGEPGTTPTAVPSSDSPTVPTDGPTGQVVDTAVVYRPAERSSSAWSGTSGWTVRGEGENGSGEPAPGAPTGVDQPTGLPDGLAAELAAAGLETTPASLGRWTGPCPVCPDGFVPTVLVLDSAAGIGLPSATVALLEAGFAVTPFNVAGVESQAVAGVPVRVGDVPGAAQAAVLASSVAEPVGLTDVQPVLVGSAGGLDAEQADEVAAIVSAAGLWVDSGSWTLSEAWNREQSLPIGGDAEPTLWPWSVVLVAVTLLVTAAHRREHGEAAAVLRVIGSTPRTTRRLASLTAGSLAGVGVVMGLTLTIVVVGAAAAQRRYGSGWESARFDGLWNREATALLVVSLLIPVVVALLARLIPPARPRRGWEGAAPA